MRPNAWLKLGSSVEDDSTAQAHSQLRKMYIPQATFLLMDVLSKTGQPGDALRVCNWIASPRHSVHKVRVVYVTDLMGSVYFFQLLFMCISHSDAHE